MSVFLRVGAHAQVVKQLRIHDGTTAAAATTARAATTAAVCLA